MKNIRGYIIEIRKVDTGLNKNSFDRYSPIGKLIMPIFFDEADLNKSKIGSIIYQAISILEQEIGKKLNGPNTTKRNKSA